MCIIFVVQNTARDIGIQLKWLEYLYEKFKRK